MPRIKTKLLALAVLPAVVLPVLAACSDRGASAAGASPSTSTARNGVAYNTSPEQNRIRAEKDPGAAAEVPAAIGKDGKLTVGTTAAAIPLSFYATDNKTPIGVEVDIAPARRGQAGARTGRAGHPVGELAAQDPVRGF
ncbi:hypothetical protein GCM10023063_47510 [Arthrobacter methylotrophus]